MGLKITADYSEKQISDYFNRQLELYVQHVIRVYSKAGVAMVEDARERSKEQGDSFGNITWDLRSSIGCVVYRDGVKVFDYFPVLETGADGSEKGREYADSLAEGTEGIVMIVVAGMHYARAVQDRGYNVITATSFEAEHILQDFINKAAA